MGDGRCRGWPEPGVVGPGRLPAGAGERVHHVAAGLRDHRPAPVYAPVDLDLPGGPRVEPDLVVVPNASIGAERLSLPVLVVVELISPSTAVWDQVAKREAYAAAGIEHYWMVDTRVGHERFTALRLGADGYDDVVDDDRRVEIDSPVTVSVALGDLSEPPG